MQQHRHPPVGDPRRVPPAERLLELHRQHRRGRIGVVDPDPGAAGHREPLRGQLVQPGGLPPGQQPAQRRRHVDPAQVGPAAGAGQLRPEPVGRAVEQRRVVDVRPVVAERRARQNAIRRRSSGRRRRPAQQPEPLLPQPVAAAPPRPAPGPGRAAAARPARSRRAGPPRRATTSPSRQATSSRSVRSSAAPASRAVASSIGAASRTRAAGAPGARSATATASHGRPGQRRPGRQLRRRSRRPSGTPTPPGRRRRASRSG